MFTFNIILAFVLVSGIGYVAYLIKKNRALSEINNLIARELSVLIDAAAKIAKDIPKGGAKGFPPTPGELLEDPALLATILTAVVNKYGDMKIGMIDFDSIGAEDYISVYVDTNSNELILSLNPDLAPGGASPDTFGFYPQSDDGTFH